MKFREAIHSDIPQIQRVRHSVNENRLSDPALVPDKDVADYITRRGKGWVCEINRTVVGFAIADLQEHSIWALFVDPEFEKMGIGKQLHKIMMDWYFIETDQNACLGTAPGTRAEAFYTMQGWMAVGNYSNGETKFEMTKDKYVRR